MYDETLAIISHAIENFGEYDAWCLRQGFDPLKIPSRRLISSIWAWITEGMDQEQINALIISLEPNTYKEEKKRARRTRKAPDQDQYTPVSDKGKDKFRAPEGWKPPGWSEERSLNEAKKFMKFQASPTIQPK